MRILILGAGAVGGYFGRRLAQGGAEVAFLVRPGRQVQLERDGLVIESSIAGDFRGRVQALSPRDLEGADGARWDAVLLGCKAYDLDAAVAAVRPAMGPRTAIVPLLNGMGHLDTLRTAFGPERVLGGLARILAELTPEGVVRHNGGNPPTIAFGELDGRPSERVQALAAACEAAPGMAGEATGVIRQRMWEKLVQMHTGAAATVLMRANIGEIARAPGGLAWLGRLLDRNVAIAAAEGFPVRPEMLDGSIRPLVQGAQPNAQASMLFDVERGAPVEADHVLGFMLEAARRAGVADEVHEAAYVHAKAYEARRAAGRLPSSVG